MYSSNQHLEVTGLLNKRELWRALQFATELYLTDERGEIEYVTPKWAYRIVNGDVMELGVYTTDLPAEWTKFSYSFDLEEIVYKVFDFAETWSIVERSSKHEHRMGFKITVIQNDSKGIGLLRIEPHICVFTEKLLRRLKKRGFKFMSMWKSSGSREVEQDVNK